MNEHSCEMTIKDSGHGVTPLHLAASAGHTEILRLYASKDGSLLEVKDKHGRTPLHYACQDGHVEVAKFLKEQGCNPEHKDKKGITPKTLAMINGHTNVANLFGGGPASGSPLPVSDYIVCDAIEMGIGISYLCHTHFLMVHLKARNCLKWRYYYVNADIVHRFSSPMVPHVVLCLIVLYIQIPIQSTTASWTNQR